ncbi:hypothetical protein AAG570_006022 [Ranatra chinensis]|uniref:Uncharacterized protein n=1 Tax=Ranatra chinensis TaxID=642074 RepID=A0ABD0XWU5_9HEMI
MFYENKKQETTEIATLKMAERGNMSDKNKDAGEDYFESDCHAKGPGFYSLRAGLASGPLGTEGCIYTVAVNTFPAGKDVWLGLRHIIHLSIRNGPFKGHRIEKSTRRNRLLCRSLGDLKKRSFQGQSITWEKLYAVSMTAIAGEVEAIVTILHYDKTLVTMSTIAGKVQAIVTILHYDKTLVTMSTIAGKVQAIVTDLHSGMALLVHKSGSGRGRDEMQPEETSGIEGPAGVDMRAGEEVRRQPEEAGPGPPGVVVLEGAVGGGRVDAEVEVTVDGGGRDWHDNSTTSGPGHTGGARRPTTPPASSPPPPPPRVEEWGAPPPPPPPGGGGVGGAAPTAPASRGGVGGAAPAWRETIKEEMMERIPKLEQLWSKKDPSSLLMSQVRTGFFLGHIGTRKKYDGEEAKPVRNK